MQFRTPPPTLCHRILIPSQQLTKYHSNCAHHYDDDSDSGDNNHNKRNPRETHPHITQSFSLPLPFPVPLSPSVPLLPFSLLFIQIDSFLRYVYVFPLGRHSAKCMRPAVLSCTTLSEPGSVPSNIGSMNDNFWTDCTRRLSVKKLE